MSRYDSLKPMCSKLLGVVTVAIATDGLTGNILVIDDNPEHLTLLAHL